MAMSRKHYREAADVIRGEVLIAEGSPEIVRDAQLAALEAVADGLARMFKADNSNFRREQFMEACGLSEPRVPQISTQSAMDGRIYRSGIR